MKLFFRKKMRAKLLVETKHGLRSGNSATSSTLQIWRWQTTSSREHVSSMMSSRKQIWLKTDRINLIPSRIVYHFHTYRLYIYREIQ